MIYKKDLENALMQYRARLINSKVQIKADEFMVKEVEDMIKNKEYEEEDPMPDDVKEVIKEVTE